MTPYRTLLYLVKRKRRYKKLILPFSFFLMETMLIALITFNILGFNIFNMNDRYASEPMVLVRMLHPPEMVVSNFSEGETVSWISINNSISPLLTFANFVSIVIAIIGLVMATLWMNRFFKRNALNIEWWLWPVGCVGAHTMFLFFIV